MTVVAGLTGLRIATEIASAVAAGGPVVALESTIVAHGLPFPDNLEVARACEAAVRAAGALPATVAVVAGEVVVGLAAAELEALARRGREVPKVGAADLAVAVGLSGDGATTVSATTWAAARAGIRVFATGGIGGVHRGDDADVSSDLRVMADEQVCVVSAGAKAILDLPRTLERLETLGVLVLGFGCAEFPAFYTRSSGLPLEHHVDTASQVARVLEARWRRLGMKGGVLLANPIPEAAALDRAEIDAAIEAALAAASAGGVKGKALTPFLLAELARTTGARSVVANRALAVHNCSVAGAVASELGKLALLAKKAKLSR